MTRAGLAKVDITCLEPDMVMMGWGQLDQRATGVGTRLFARALVVEDRGKRVAIVAAELLFISTAIRAAVLARLAEDGLGPHEVLLAATHTHSGPSGYTQYLGYNASNFGFSHAIFDALVDGIVRAVREAIARLEPAELRVGAAKIPLHEPALFNRSPAAYNANQDTAPIDPESPEAGTHRETVVLRVDGVGGRPLGLVNWLGVHGSSFHSDHPLVEADNKGLAAAELERAIEPESPGFVALFLQEAAGDVSPNFRPDPARGLAVGAGEDDRGSCAANAEIQRRYATLAWADARRSEPIRGAIEHVTLHVDFGEAFVGEARTRPPVLGLAMAAGTDEGPGPLRPVARLLRALGRARPRDAKLPWLTGDGGAARGRFLGVVPMRLGLWLVAKVEPRIAFVRAIDRAGLLGDDPWLPRVLPLQLLKLGDLQIAAVPFEPTTVAGRRIRAALAFSSPRVVVTSYANGYGGYAATPEEYRTQHYEGGATLFGEQTVPAIVNELEWLARAGGAPADAGVMGPPLRDAPLERLRAQRAIGESWLARPPAPPEEPPAAEESAREPTGPRATHVRGPGSPP